ncbi:MAG: methyltransferase domain-containing protein [Acidimicrobiia bacterium]
MRDTEVAPDGSSTAATFGHHYFEHYWPGIEPYRRDDYWLGFFRGIAGRISTDLQPRSVLDAGCALGILVETLRERAIEAWGVDISEWAIANAHESVRDYCWQASLTEPLSRRYDLISCIEVLEHLPNPELDVAIDNLCAATDRILLSSTPSEYGEPTHVNVRPTEDWAALFARRGFVRNLDLDASFVSPWAVVYDRSSDPLPEVVRRYERSVYRLRDEVRQVREQILDQERRLSSAEGEPVLLAENQRLNEELFASRETVISHEAKLGEALGRARYLEAELVRYQECMDELDLVHRSRAWRALGVLRRLLGRAR